MAAGTGSPASEWDISGAGDSSIQGFTTDISANLGEVIHFKIKTNAAAYTLNIYRMGYYGGDGAQKIATVSPSASLPQNQPACLTDSATGLIDCGNWAESATWTIPQTAQSGIYFAKVIRSDTGGASHVFFVVRDDSSHSDIVFQTSDTTWQAYNQYGGNSLYVGGPASSPSRAYKVSFNRPITTRSTGPEDFIFNAEYPMVRWLEANGYNVTYTTGVDTDRRGSLIRNHKVFLSVGHDEYWSAAERANVEAAREAGVSFCFLSGNEVFWKTRWENSISSPATSYRTMVAYKETHANAVIDPQDPPTWTGTWRDPRFSPPADGGRPENALTGTIFTVNCCNTGLTITVPQDDGKMRFWRNTSIATLPAGGSATLTAGVLDYEWDEDLDNGARPAGLVRLSTTATAVSSYLQDYGSTFSSGSATHHLTLYKRPSGALVFGAGTVQWSWGLDANHDRGSGAPADVRMQQATVNLLADMGVQPTTLQSGLVSASQSSDITPPSSTISSPSAGSSVASNSTLTVSGSASDVGGVVGGVEVSVDGGATWHPANGRASWTYAWRTGNNGTVQLMSRAVDDSGNIQSPPTSITVTVGNGGTATCPCSIWPATAVPSTPSDTDNTGVELGVKFRSDASGTVSGVRFYKSSGNTGTHTGHLWSSSGTLLGSVTFSNETASGWQQANFASGIAISANTTYVISYYAPVGHYAGDVAYFSSTGIDNAPLHALADGADGSNGVYAYGSASTFPNQTYSSTNYWVDLVFNTSTGGGTPPTISNVTATPSSTTAIVTWTTNVAADSRVDYGVTSSSLNFTATGAAMVTSHSVTLTGLTPGNTYFYRVTSAVSGGASASSPTGSPATFLTTGTPPCPCSVWKGGEDSSSTPATVDDGDPTAGEVGMRFRSDVAGYVTGIRFYKATTNIGSHIGNLWTNTGALLGTVTFSNETATGWQAATFATSIPISPNITYVISYYSPSGHYSETASQFAAAGVDTPPLHALASGVDGLNGVYTYGSASAFPTQTFNSTNYWVDAVFNLTAVQASPPVISGVTATPGTTTATITWTTDVASNSRVDFGTSTSLGSTTSDTNQVTSHSVTLTGLTAGTVYYYRVTSAVPSGPSSTSPVTSASPATFTTGASAAPPVISGVSAAPTSTTAVVTWTTDLPSSSRVDFGTVSTTLGSNVSSATLVTSHSVTLTGLTAGTVYYYRVTSAVASGPSSTSPVTSASPATFTTGASVAPPVISSVSAAPTSTTAVVTWTTDLPSSSRVDFGTVSTTLGSNVSSATLVTSHSLTLTGLTAGKVYYYRVTSTAASGLSSTSPATGSNPASFTTTSCPCSIWTTSSVPGTPSDSDNAAVEIGLKFRSDVAGTITAIRFYKGSGNTGSHVGHLWSSTGTLLATVTFTGETASGWQQANLTTPVNISANTTYVVSYHAPVGHYAGDVGYFASAGVTNGGLHALANGVDGPNGVYKYGAAAFPNLTFNSTNYWVDVVFR